MADVISEAEKLGLLCIAAHIDRPKTGFEMIADGYPNWKQDILLSPGLYGIEVDQAAHLGWFGKDDEAGDAGGQRRATRAEEERAIVEDGAARARGDPEFRLPLADPVRDWIGVKSVDPLQDDRVVV